MISSVLSEIEKKFHDIDRRISLSQGKVHRFFDEETNHNSHGLPYKEEGPSDASLETLELLESLEKEMDSHISHIQESNSSLESFCAESSKQIEDSVRFLVSVMNYASNNYGTSFPAAIKETLDAIVCDKEAKEAEEVRKDKIEEAENNEEPIDVSKADNANEECAIDKPNPLHFGISKLGLEKLGFSFYSKDSIQSEDSSNKDSSIVEPPVLISSKKQTKDILSVRDDTESPLEMKSREISTPSSPPLREKPQEISPGLFVRVRKSKGKKSVSPEAPTLSIPLNSNPSFAPPLQQFSEEKISLDNEAQKENMNDSFGPPAEPKLFTRQFI